MSISTPIHHGSRGGRPRAGFTLIEVLAVTILMACTVAMVTVNMRGVSDAARLDAALAQLASFDALVRTQALADGTPRMLSLERDASALTVRRLQISEPEMPWSEPSTLRWVSGVTVQACSPQLTISGDEYSSSDAEACSIRVFGDGTTANYAVRLGTGELDRILVVNGATGLTKSVEVPDGTTDELSELLAESSPCDAYP